MRTYILELRSDHLKLIVKGLHVLSETGFLEAKDALSSIGLQADDTKWADPNLAQVFSNPVTRPKGAEEIEGIFIIKDFE